MPESTLTICSIDGAQIISYEKLQPSAYPAHGVPETMATLAVTGSVTWKV
jgi:hypothetical protein